jgi:hypothetical protein
MLLAEADGRTVLLTGDGHGRDVVRGLKEAGRLDEQGRIHVDVLKVQHHGAVANMTPAFARDITADVYIFCGDGEHGNPEPRVVREILDARLGTQSAPAAGPQGRFKLLFNSSAETPGREENRKHMGELEREVAARARRSDGRFTYSFASRASFSVTLRRRR